MGIATADSIEKVMEKGHKRVITINPPSPPLLPSFIHSLIDDGDDEGADEMQCMVF